MEPDNLHDGHQPPLLEELHTAAAELHGALDRLEDWLTADAASDALAETAVQS